MKFEKRFVLITAATVASILISGLSLCSTTYADWNDKLPFYEVVNAQQRCESLKDVTIKAADIGLPTNGAVITSATLQAATPQTGGGNTNIVLAIPEYCKILGHIDPIDPTAPPINFQISLPTKWNKRSMQFGGGGFNGSVVDGLGTRFPQPQNDPRPITRGYATFGSDSGHTGNNASFGLNDEALRNFAYEQLKKTKDTAFHVIKSYYGNYPKYRYFNGHSEGGREGHAVMQRFPEDYDGVIAVVPILNIESSHLHDNAILTALAFGGLMNKAKINLLTKSTLDACDELDGVKDGVISKYGTLDPRSGKWKAACNHDVEVLRCKSGADEGDHCLSDAQVAAVKLIREPFVLPYTLASGSPGYQGLGAMGGENNPGAWDTVRMGTVPPPTTQPPGLWSLAGVPNIPIYGHSNVRYLVAQDPNFQTYNFDTWLMRRYEKRIQYLSSILDTLNPDISKFQKHGGKLIMKENTSDYHRTTFLGLNYYKSLLDKFGKKQVSRFVRLYASVGPDHFGRNEASEIDLITLIENWVEKGIAPPNNVTGVLTDPKTFDVLKSRPACGYGLYPKYKGGDPNVFSSFICAPLN